MVLLKFTLMINWCFQNWKVVKCQMLMTFTKFFHNLALIYEIEIYLDKKRDSVIFAFSKMKDYFFIFFQLSFSTRLYYENVFNLCKSFLLWSSLNLYTYRSSSLSLTLNFNWFYDKLNFAFFYFENLAFLKQFSYSESILLWQPGDTISIFMLISA